MSEDLSDPTVAHGKPTPDMCCLCSYEDITEEDGNYVEYMSSPSLTWSPSLFELPMITHLLSTQFSTYMSRVKSTDCQAELRRLLASGPPVWVSDKTALPLPEGDTHVERLWYAKDGKERSARLVGSVVGEERERLIEELRKFVVVEGKEEGDEEEKGEEQGEGKE
ncbi:hypothetical protein TrVE_jg1525 [Triparma verrucosa]|uniref:Uncharacterized protein n=1 Tax=Triparma verrucosa TaxID=1606542 RepID=A0A9W7CEK9_9STRA|nr:hypothetical protein TrVE_jg1525 [Triparma verrucosa]